MEKSRIQLKRSPLHSLCIGEGAKMVPFAGWEMPVQFKGLIHEHHAVRREAGLFDISHMGVLRIKGENAKGKLQKLVPSDLNRIGPGEACYSLLLNEKGGVIDDLIIYDVGSYKEDEDNLILIINAACEDTDIKWLKNNIEIKDLYLKDEKGEKILLAIQGPKAKNILEKSICYPLDNIPTFGHKYISLNEDSNHSVFVARTGYTGEDGFEILLERDPGKKIWEQLIESGATPCGLGARDTLRIEAGMHLYGNELSQTTTPFEAGLGWLTHLEMEADFIGRSSLEKQVREGCQKKLIGLKINSRGIARSGYKVLYKEIQIGEITSGTWSPTLEQGIAMAYVEKEFAGLGNTLDVNIRGKNHQATVVKRNFYRRD